MCDIKSTNKYMLMNIVLDQPIMRILHGLQVISNSHHSDVFFLSFDLTLERTQFSFKTICIISLMNIVE